MVELRPEAHLYLADVYFQLADACQIRGWAALAQHFKHRAHEHDLAGPPPEPTPLAMVMGIPEPPVITDTRGKLTPPRRPKEDEMQLLSH